jgi:hypothetical protein
LTLMAAKEKRIARGSRSSSSQETDNYEPPLNPKFITETARALEELDSRMGKTFSSKKQFLEDLERL